jgi:hypothetical protein
MSRIAKAVAVTLMAVGLSMTAVAAPADAVAHHATFSDTGWD